jgi:hypothetical protein
MLQGGSHDFSIVAQSPLTVNVTSFSIDWMFTITKVKVSGLLSVGQEYFGM